MSPTLKSVTRKSEILIAGQEVAHQISSTVLDHIGLEKLRHHRSLEPRQEESGG